jgi:cell division protein DivIC
VARKITKKTKRRVLLITSLTVTVFLAFSFNLWKTLSQVIDKNSEAKVLQKEMQRLEDEEMYLKVEVEKLNDPEYVARYAREKYFYSKNGEFTIKIPKAQ